MNESLAFVLCTEQGPLEQMSTLFALTLRRFGGRLSNAPMYSYAPRPGRDIGDTTRRCFERLQVGHKHIPLNTRFQNYPLANKAFVAAYAEEHLRADIIVWVDSDVLLLAEPSALLVPGEFDIALRPVDVKGIGVCDDQDEEHPYWQQLYSVCGVQDRRYVETTIDGTRIWGYWNSGLIASRRQKKILSLWAENLAKAITAGLMPKGGMFYVEQSSLAASVVAAKARVHELPHSYNYPLHLHHVVKEPWRIEKLENMVTAHYHRIFGRGGRYPRQNPLAAFLNSGEQDTWLIEQLDATGVYPRSYWKRFCLGLRERTRARVGRIGRRLGRYWVR